MTYDIGQALALDALWTLNEVCEQVTDDQLGLPTPCTGWNLSTLLDHMTGQHRGIAASLSGAAEDLDAWRPLPVGPGRVDLFASIQAVRDRLLTELPPSAWLPEVAPTPLPSAVVVRAHLVDTVAHGWDVAATIGGPVRFSPATLAAAYQVARQISDGPERDRPGSAFAHALPGGDEPTLAGYLALLGRDIAWSPVG
ncbi:TIGR03086 family metal-binding protein [Microlunatus endophyticus]|uniref:TIGR03086 family metal-binding protein n=1 Tax=Microlunatus endophyticus TaxID=1716077 RepID=UPI0016642965|nr:TIGR03086 family metal-binding protein [Microlunatus endophyticus]